MKVIQCCDLHGRNCEPPAELCCGRCTEARHAGWVDGRGTPRYGHPPGEECSAPPARECPACGAWLTPPSGSPLPDHDTPGGARCPGSGVYIAITGGH